MMGALLYIVVKYLIFFAFLAVAIAAVGAIHKVPPG